MITVQFYSPEKKSEWNNFINESKNGTFMLNREYVEYHSDRFVDYSLMFYDEKKLIAVLPASLHGNEVRSHGGLTYGGIVSNKKMTILKMEGVFEELRKKLNSENINKLLYKRIPSIYYTYPADEDLYALFKNGAKLIRRDISTTIYLPDKIKFSSLRKRCVKKAKDFGLEIRESSDYVGFINLMTDVLAKHHNHAKPVHSSEELRFLASKFPNNIKLFCAFKSKRIMAGVLIFESKQVVHTQYIANSEEGRNVGALDLVMDYLINNYSIGKTFFDFGISTENEGMILNHGLVGQKEMFGGRGIVYDFYEWNI